MKKLASLAVIIALVSSPAFSQEETRRHSSGPRRQLATIVFAGLGGAILGLSTLSFYGRPQDQLSNIAIGFAVGVIAGTAYVTLRSATSRDYYDDKQPPATLLGLPQQKLVVQQEGQFEDKGEPSFFYGPMVARVSPEASVVGGTLAFKF